MTFKQIETKCFLFIKHLKINKENIMKWLFFSRDENSLIEPRLDFSCENLDRRSNWRLDFLYPEAKSKNRDDLINEISWRFPEKNLIDRVLFFSIATFSSFESSPRTSHYSSVLQLCSVKCFFPIGSDLYSTRIVCCPSFDRCSQRFVRSR